MKEIDDQNAKLFAFAAREIGIQCKKCKMLSEFSKNPNNALHETVCTVYSVHGTQTTLRFTYCKFFPFDFDFFFLPSAAMNRNIRKLSIITIIIIMNKRALCATHRQ